MLFNKINLKHTDKPFSSRKSLDKNYLDYQNIIITSRPTERFIEISTL